MERCVHVYSEHNSCKDAFMYIVNIIHCAMISQLCGDTIMWKKTITQQCTKKLEKFN